MNWLQFGSFVVFFLSVLIVGVRAYSALEQDRKVQENRAYFLGQVLLLGGIVVVGELLVLALIHLYSGPFLWSVIILNYACLMSTKTRKRLSEALLHPAIDIPAGCFIILLAIFILRNCYFMMDIDSHSVYLFAQRLWLEAGHCFVGNRTNDIRIFVPHFDAVPYSLGLSLFGQEVLFPQLINIFWRVVALLLVYGYTAYRLNGYYGLAAAMLMVFNEHFFISGANNSVVINGALIALIFASICNFWESRRRSDPFCFLLALIFLTQLIGNKYQLVYVSMFILFTGLLLQRDLLKNIKLISKNRLWILSLGVALGVTCIFYIKNFIVTGDPFFPIFAGRLSIFGWTVAQEKIFLNVFGGVTPFKFIKYESFFFIWPGIVAAKYCMVVIFFLPLIFLIENVKEKIIEDDFLEMCYWLGMGTLIIMGVALTNHQDPRYFRFALAVVSFAAVFSLRNVLLYCFRIKKEAVAIVIIIVLCTPGYKRMFKPLFGSPTIQENVAVLCNKVHMQDVLNRSFPHIKMYTDAMKDNPDKAKKSAYTMGEGVNFHSFLLPTKPFYSLWATTLVRWNSYADRNLILDDFRDAGVDWVMLLEEKGVRFVPIEEYSSIVMKFNRSPDKTFYSYGMPDELTQFK